MPLLPFASRIVRPIRRPSLRGVRGTVVMPRGMQRLRAERMGGNTMPGGDKGEQTLTSRMTAPAMKAPRARRS
jgi:hypothetical protein